MASQRANVRIAEVPISNFKKIGQSDEGTNLMKEQTVTLTVVGIAAFLLLSARKQQVAAKTNLSPAQQNVLKQGCTFSGLGKLLGGLISGSTTKAQTGAGSAGGGKSSGGGVSGGGGGSSAPAKNATGSNPQGPCLQPSTNPDGTICAAHGACFNSPCITPCNIPNTNVPACFNSSCITPCNTPNTPGAGPNCFPATPGCCVGGVGGGLGFDAQPDFVNLED